METEEENGKIRRKKKGLITVINTTIRKYDTKDTDIIADIFFNASLLAYPFFTRPALEQEKINVREIYLPAVETWVIEKQPVSATTGSAVSGENAEVVGFVSLMEKEVAALFVAPEQQGQGYGQALMDKAVAEKGGELEVDVFKENSIGRNFYRRYGFVQINESLHEPTGQMCLRMKLGKSETQPKEMP
ncbi:GNAT family N-acetyltransferase [Kiloniella laminariae]|uniref:GNAT family N-acetyltransferase n=1 Tax=Kiloniella laminariae TaxID=454162 RepID=A0ABT4LFK6_9PROT|nr:GNAT family N-acetyltransferase [Kiloniella laminariae]MCZ4279893.1 GNAT family N-acetyltransferase [Kiloniella laminariae]